MLAETGTLLVIRLTLIVLGAVALILAAERKHVLGHWAIDALIGGVITAALIFVYPPPIAAELLTGVLWLAHTCTAHVLAHFKAHLDASTPSSNYTFDIEALEDLFEFEEVP